jgi:hypothetical protein
LRFVFLAGFCFVAPSSVWAQTEELERRVQALEDNERSRRGLESAYAGRDDGFGWSTQDGRHALLIGGFLRPLYELAYVSGSMENSGFAIENARLLLTGKVDSDWRFRVWAELSTPEAPLRDFYFEYRWRPEVVIRAGQMQVPFLRSNLSWETEQAFPFLGGVIENDRYDRDIGVMVHGRAGDLYYMAGAYNGAGENSPNDNLDLMEAVRIEYALFGAPVSDRIDGNYLQGDYERLSSPRLTLGAGATHDLVALPANVAGVPIGERDADGSGRADNVRVLCASADAVFRLRGLELMIEGLVRQERWGTILTHSENQSAAFQIGARADGTRNYGALTAQALMFVLPERLQAGARVTAGELPLLGLGGRAPLRALPAGDRRIDIDGTLAWFADERGRMLGLTYRFTHFLGAGDDGGENVQAIVLEGLFRL